MTRDFYVARLIELARQTADAMDDAQHLGELPGDMSAELRTTIAHLENAEPDAIVPNTVTPPQDGTPGHVNGDAADPDHYCECGEPWAAHATPAPGLPDIAPEPWVASNRWGNFGDHNRAEPDAPVGQVSRFSYSVRDAHGFVVAHCTNPLVTCTAERSEAHARLMAAAPRLARSLKSLADWAREHTSPNDDNSPHHLLVSACEALHAAGVGLTA